MLGVGVAGDRAQGVVDTVAEGGELGHVHVELLERTRLVGLVHLGEHLLLHLVVG